MLTKTFCELIMSDNTNDNKSIDLAKTLINQYTAKLFDRVGRMLGMSHDGKRDLYQIYGYDTSLSGNQGFERMYAYSRRQGIANRLTFGIAKRCWRDGFNILADQDDPDSSVLIDEIKKLNRAGLTKKLEQADILNRIGRFSVLLVGIPDGRDLSEPVGNVRGDGFKSIFFKTYAYDGVEIHAREMDKNSPRYNLPVIYSVQRGQTRDGLEKDVGVTEALFVHWTRIVHLNEQALDSDVEGMGYLEPIFNRILDLDKACGGSAEAYFRNAKGKIAYEIDKDFALDLTNDDVKKAFNTAAEKFTNEYQDHVMGQGSKIKTLDTPHDSPLDTVKVLLWEISGYSGLPIRILTGEGSGQLAGSEDQLAYNQIIADRQRLVCTMWLWRVLEILDTAAMIKLDDFWVVDFPLQTAVTEAQQTDIDNKKSDTLNKIVHAKNLPGGDGLDIDSALSSLGLGDIKYDEINLQEIDNDVDSLG